MQLAFGNSAPQVLSELLGIANVEGLSAMNGRPMALMPDVKVSDILVVFKPGMFSTIHANLPDMHAVKSLLPKGALMFEAEEFDCYG